MDAIISVHIGTVKTRINRGRLKLRDKYMKLEKKKNKQKNITFSKNELLKGGDK